MKLALVTAFPPSHGSLNEYGFHLAKEFAANPDVSDLVIIADKMEDNQTETVEFPKVSIKRTWQFNSSMAGLQILCALKAEKVDAVVYNLQTATFGDREIPAALGLFSPAVTRLFGFRSGVLAHNLIEGIDLENTILKGSRLRQCLVKLGGWAVSLGMARANYVTTTLDIYADVLKSRFPAADISMVPHGTFDRPAIDIKKVNQRPNRIVTMGKFGTYKKLGTLIDAFRILLQIYPTLELIIGGTDHPNTQGYMDEMQRQCSDLNSVRFVGYIAEEDVPSFFAGAKFAVFDYEATTGSSGVLHQCASYGTVPILPKIGDFVELCDREGLCGFNYEVGDSVDMAKTISEALHDPVALEQVSTGNLRAMDEYPLSKVAEFHVQKLAKHNGAGKLKRDPIIN
ncbi:MAG: glycosyltransferase [Pseudomonadota bacterium]